MTGTAIRGHPRNSEKHFSAKSILTAAWPIRRVHSLMRRPGYVEEADLPLSKKAFGEIPGFFFKSQPGFLKRAF